MWVLVLFVAFAVLGLRGRSSLSSDSTWAFVVTVIVLLLVALKDRLL